MINVAAASSLEGTPQGRYVTLSPSIATMLDLLRCATASASVASDASFPSMASRCRRNEAFFWGRSAPIFPNAFATRRSLAGTLLSFAATNFFDGAAIVAAGFFLGFVAFFATAFFAGTAIFLAADFLGVAAFLSGGAVFFAAA
ncbi:hypothetical protein EJI00_05910 [Variovorax sp. DXTD-1]|nr:hypothetical protein EJI00_05910 [Variovorax sp. DXTD-1]